LKKWLLLIVVAIGFLIPINAFASTIIFGKDVTNKNYAYLQLSTGAKMLVYTTDMDSTWKFTGDNQITLTSGGLFDAVYSANGTTVSTQPTNINTMGIGVGVTVTVIEAVNSIKNTDGSYFFRVAGPIAEAATPQTVVTQILETLGTGGLLGLGLVILGIMLVVSLVPRLRSWFLR